MKPFSIASIAMLLLTVSSARENSLDAKSMRPSHWLSPLQIEQIPSIEEITLEKLENMSVEKGADVTEKIYHVSQISHNLRPKMVSNLSSTPVYLYKPSAQKITTTLEKMPMVSKQLPDMGRKKVTIIITGMPAITDSIKKANLKLIEAHLQRYSSRRRDSEKDYHSDEKSKRSSSEEDPREWKTEKHSTGYLLVIDLGAKLKNFVCLTLLDTEQTGAHIASAIMEMAEKNDISHNNLHIVAQGIAAHVAGAAGNEYYRRTGRKLRRITALDPSKLYAKEPRTLSGLKRGDAEFVDAIHTNSYGLGTIQHVGDVDFYPNGPSTTVPGAKNIVEASMRATHYYAESVRPGNEWNFPATAAKSLKEYLNKDGYGRRAYMGIATDHDVKGDYILEVNGHSPFGKRAQKLWNATHNNE